MDELTSLVARSGFLPHGYCFQWSPGLLWTMVGADLAIALAYFSIPVLILAYARQRPQLNFGGLAALFAVFILACGATHVLDVWTIWRPDYEVQTAGKVVTAVRLGADRLDGLAVAAALPGPSFDAHAPAQRGAHQAAREMDRPAP